MEKFGVDLATKVCIRLLYGGSLKHSHRDYCGTGLFYRGVFVYAYVEDGFLDRPILEFQNETDFINWLAEQTDQTLSGEDEKEKFYRHNQRITKERLVEFVS